jgi:hypothetical protein
MSASSPDSLSIDGLLEEIDTVLHPYHTTKAAKHEDSDVSMRRSISTTTTSPPPHQQLQTSKSGPANFEEAYKNIVKQEPLGSVGLLQASKPNSFGTNSRTANGNQTRAANGRPQKQSTEDPETAMMKKTLNRTIAYSNIYTNDTTNTNNSTTLLPNNLESIITEGGNKPRIQRGNSYLILDDILNEINSAYDR